MMKKSFLQFYSLMLAMFLALGVNAQTASELFFSEYAEGSSSNKYLEIYNATGAAVDLHDYVILENSNGGPIDEYVDTMTGMLADKSVYVIANGSANAFITAAKDVTISGVCYFNGDDARALAKVVTDGSQTDTITFDYDADGTDEDVYVVILDVIGEFPDDPGSAWDVAGVTDATKDHTLIRKPTVDAPNSDWASSAGTSMMNSEWIVLTQDSFTNIGMHIFTGPPPPPAKPKYTVSQINSLDSNFVADSLGVECYIEGIVIGPDYDGNAGLSFTLYDGEGINIYNYKDVDDYVVREGDLIEVYGVIAQYNGLLELKPDTIKLVDSFQTIPNPNVVTMLGETTESELIMIEKVMLVDTTEWPAAGSDANVQITNGVDTFVMRIDKDIDIAGTPFPVLPFNVIGIGGQFDWSAPHNEGYQIFPRGMKDIHILIPPPVYTISQITGVDANGEPDSLGVKCMIQGVVHGTNYRAYKPGLQFVLHDGTDGIWVYSYDDLLGYDFKEGDEIAIIGEVDFYNGLTEFAPEEIMLIDSNQTLNTPVVTTALNEANEAELVKLEMVWVADTTQWPEPTDYAVNVDVTNGVDTFVMRLVTDCDVHGTPVRKDTFHLVGLVGQFDAMTPYDEGYQIFPRYQADLIHHNPVSIEEEFATKFRMFPNPNSGQFLVENNSRKEVEITVISSVGSIVYSTKTTQMLHSINIDDASGIYFVRINEVDGEGVYTGRIFVK
jgi:hypothetical protein